MSTVPLQRGESEKLAGNHDIVLTRWRNKRDVHIVGTNTDGPDGVKPRSRYCAEPMPIPNMILDYNQHMGGVDHLDQFRAYYDVGRAGRKWWKYIMFGLFNFAIVNAYVLKCLANKPLPSNPANRCVVSVYGCSLCRASLCRGGRCFQEFHALL